MTPRRPPHKRAKLLLTATIAALTGLGLAVALTGNHPSTKKAAAPRPSSSPAPPSPATTPPAPSPTPSSPQTLSFDWTQLDEGSDPGTIADPITSFFAPLGKGRGVPGSAAYAGTAHPMAFIHTDGQDSSDWEWDIAQNFQTGSLDNTDTFSPPDGGNPLLFTDTGQVQLVAVVNDADVQAASCGSYTRDDGKAGELRRTENVLKLTIRAALTGRVIAARTFTNLPPCARHFGNASDPSGDWGVNYDGNPPWYITANAPLYDGTSAGDTAVQKWIDWFLTGPVRS